MSLKLSKTNTPAYNYLSEDGAMTNPAVCAVTIDKSGGTKTSSPVTLYLVAVGAVNVGSYTGISVTPRTLTTGITWQVSLNGTDWLSSVEPTDMDCSSSDVVRTLYARIQADNSESSPLTTGNFPGEFTINAVENPPGI